MTDAKLEPVYWTDVYLKNQEEFMRRWTQMAGQAAPGAMPFGNMGASGFPPLPDWSSMFTSQFQGPAADVARKYFGLYEQYMGATRALTDLLTRAMSQPEPAARATEFMRGVPQLQQQFTNLWSQAISVNTGMNLGSGDGGTEALQSMLRGFGAAEAPALGLTRERQESLQRTQKLLGELGQQQATLMTQWGEVIGEALQRLGQRVAERLQSGGSFESVKVLYDTWIECAEAAYAKAAHSPAYAKAQADLATTLAKLRIEQRQSIEVVSKQFDLPTRDELNTVHRRIKDLKAEVRKLRAELDQQKPRPKRAKSKRSV